MEWRPGAVARRSRWQWRNGLIGSHLAVIGCRRSCSGRAAPQPPPRRHVAWRRCLTAATACSRRPPARTPARSARRRSPATDRGRRARRDRLVAAEERVPLLRRPRLARRHRGHAVRHVHRGSRRAFCAPSASRAAPARAASFAPSGTFSNGASRESSPRSSAVTSTSCSHGTVCQLLREFASTRPTASRQARWRR